MAIKSLTKRNLVRNNPTDAVRVQDVLLIGAMAGRRWVGFEVIISKV